MRLRLQPAVLGNFSQLLHQTYALDPPSHPCEISLAFNPWLLHLQPQGSNRTSLQKERASASSLTGSVPSSTPSETSCPTTIPKILHRQTRTTALNQATFHTTRMTGTADEISAFADKLAPRLGKLNPLPDPANLAPPLSKALPVPTVVPNSPQPCSLPWLLNGNYYNTYPTHFGLVNIRCRLGHSRSGHNHKYSVHIQDILPPLKLSAVHS